MEDGGLGVCTDGQLQDGGEGMKQECKMAGHLCHSKTQREMNTAVLLISPSRELYPSPFTVGFLLQLVQYRNSSQV